MVKSVQSIIMRQIKFRAWDKKLNKWNLSVEIDCLGNIQEYEFNGSAFHAKYETDYDEWYGSEKGIDRFILCQFTGLLDKNGKEIYEGDILEGFDYPVGFMEGAFGCRILYDQIFLILHNCPQKELLVLGNIYENPELLIK